MGIYKDVSIQVQHIIVMLIKGKNKVKFDYVFDKGSSFQMCAHIVSNQEYCEINKEEAMSSKIIMYEEELHEKLGHPSTELILSTAKKMDQAEVKKNQVFIMCARQGEEKGYKKDQYQSQQGARKTSIHRHLWH